MVSPKAYKIYVDGQLALKANHLTTKPIHQNRGRYITRAQSQPINRLYKDRGRFCTRVKG
ncbi:MAG: hypothetical protein ACKPKO_29965 [Candidatus Fonsibacter sp.]